MKSIIITFHLFLITTIAYSQTNEKAKSKQITIDNTSSSTKTENKSEDSLEESKNPEDFVYEKKVINGKEVYYRKNKRLTITYQPKQ